MCISMCISINGKRKNVKRKRKNEKRKRKNEKRRVRIKIVMSYEKSIKTTTELSNKSCFYLSIF